MSAYKYVGNIKIGSSFTIYKITYPVLLRLGAKDLTPTFQYWFECNSPLVEYSLQVVLAVPSLLDSPSDPVRKTQTLKCLSLEEVLWNDGIFTFYYCVMKQIM